MVASYKPIIRRSICQSAERSCLLKINIIKKKNIDITNIANVLLKSSKDRAPLAKEAAGQTRMEYPYFFRPGKSVFILNKIN